MSIDPELKAHADTWIEYILSTKPADRTRIRRAIPALYAAAKLTEPIVSIVASPEAATMAGTIAFCLRHVRKNGWPKELKVKPTDAPIPFFSSATVMTEILRAVSEALGDIPPTDPCLPVPPIRVPIEAPIQRPSGAVKAYRWHLFRSFAPNDAAADWMVECRRQWHQPTAGGRAWGAWLCRQEAYRLVHKLDIAPFREGGVWFPYLDAGEGWHRYMQPEFCIVSDTPDLISKDEQNRAHSATGPCLRWRDGDAAFSVNGVSVPRYVIEAPERITLDDIRGTSHAEVQRIKIDQYGRARYLRDLNAEVIDHDIYHGSPRALLATPDGRRYLYGTDGGTGRQYAMPVPRDAKTCVEAHTAIAGFDEKLIIGQS